MVSPEKRVANNRNAQSSTGPKVTSSTRHNALKHGILSDEAYIPDRDGQDDKEVFEDFESRI